ncbi:hypothetical protein V8C86DRAFT_2875639 [Haematococcus lacustris]
MLAYNSKLSVLGSVSGPNIWTMDNKENKGVTAQQSGKPPTPATAAVVDLDTVSKYIHCSLCNGLVASSLVMPSCSHVFCGECCAQALVKKPCCPSCQVDLRAIPVRCPALDAIVHAFAIKSLDAVELKAYLARMEEGKSAANKLNKMFWWRLPSAAAPSASHQADASGLSLPPGAFVHHTAQHRQGHPSPRPPPMAHRGCQPPPPPGPHPNCLHQQRPPYGPPCPPAHPPHYPAHDTSRGLHRISVPSGHCTAPDALRNDQLGRCTSISGSLPCLDRACPPPMPGHGAVGVPRHTRHSAGGAGSFSDYSGRLQADLGAQLAAAAVATGPSAAWQGLPPPPHYSPEFQHGSMLIAERQALPDNEGNIQNLLQHLFLA